MATSTREAVLNYILDTYGLGRRGTNTGGTATSITDATNFVGARSSERVEVGCQVRITSGLRAGDMSFLSSRPGQRTGVMNVLPSFGAVLDGTSNFAVLYQPLRFAGAGGIYDALNQALQEFAWEKRIVPISEVTDGDMLSADASNWTAGGAATLAKVSATPTLPLRFLSVGGAGAGQYAQSNTIPVEPGGNYYFEVTGFRQNPGANGTLSLQDITNGGTISLQNSTIDAMEPKIVWNGSTVIPSTTFQVAIRIAKADGANNNIGVANVIFRKNWARHFSLMDRPQRVVKMGRLLAHRTLNAIRWDIRSERAMEQIPASSVQIDAGLWELNCWQYVGGLSLWYEEFVPAPQLTADTDTTPIPMRDLAPVAAEITLRPLQRDTRWADLYLRVLREAVRVRQDYQERLSQVNESPRRIMLSRL